MSQSVPIFINCRIFDCFPFLIILAEKTKTFDLFIILITIFLSQSLGFFHKFDANLIFVWLFSGPTRPDVKWGLKEAQTLSNRPQKEEIKSSISLQQADTWSDSCRKAFKREVWKFDTNFITNVKVLGINEKWVLYYYYYLY